MAVAGDWIPMQLDLTKQRETLLVASALRLRPRFTVGLLHSFWAWASSVTADGFVPGVTAEMIDRDVVDFRGFASAIASDAVGWLILEPDGVRIPNFDRWLSSGAKARMGEAVRKRLQRAGPAECPDTRPESVRTNVRTTEENRREEKPPPGVYIAGPPAFTPAISEDDHAIVALSRWAQATRGYGLNPARGEFETVGRFLVSMAAEPPIVHGGVSTARGLLIPKAADIHRERGTPFKSIRWALACIQNELADWARTGVVGQQPAKVAEPAYFDPFPKGGAA